MHNEAIIRAWKDEAFRESLTDEQRHHLPDHPAGLVELDQDDLAEAAGGIFTLSRRDCDDVPPSLLTCSFLSIDCCFAA